MIRFNVMLFPWMCHLLLGRPWKYDRNVIHDGRMNTYTLEKNGRTHMFLPIKDKEVKPEVSNTVLLMSGKELLTEVKKKEDPQFIVVRKPKIVLTSTRVDDLPDEIQELLEEFADIIVDELPHSLPPMRCESSHRSHTRSQFAKQSHVQIDTTRE